MDFLVTEFAQVPFCMICQTTGHHTYTCPFLPIDQAQVNLEERYNPPQPIYDPYSNMYHSRWDDYQDNGYEQPNYGYERFQKTHQSRESGKSLEQLIDELVANTYKFQENIMADDKPPQAESSKNLENLIAQFTVDMESSTKNLELQMRQLATTLGKLETQRRMPSQTENFSIPEDLDFSMEDEEDLDFAEEDFLDFNAMFEKESYLNTEDFNLESEVEKGAVLEEKNKEIKQEKEPEEKNKEERCLAKDLNIESKAEIEIGMASEKEKNREKEQEKGVMEMEIPVILTPGIEKEQQTEPEIENMAAPKNEPSFFIPPPLSEKFANYKKDHKDKKFFEIFSIKSISMKKFQRSSKRNWFQNARIKEGRSPKKKNKNKLKFFGHPVYKEDPGKSINPMKPVWCTELIHYDPRNPEGVT